MVDGIGAGQDDLALAVGLHRVGEDDHDLGVGPEPLGGVVEVLVGVDAQHPAPEVRRCSRSTKKPSLGVVGVVVAEAGREPGARLVERRGHEAAPGGRPLGEPPLGFGLERLELSGMSASSAGIGRQRSGRSAQGVGSHRDARSRLIEMPTPGAGKNKATCRWSLRCLPTSGASSWHGTPTASSSLARADAGQHEDVRRPDRAGAQHHLLVRA